MSEVSNPAVLELLRSAALDAADGEPRLLRLAGGANNRVFEVRSGASRAALKVYFKDDRPRLRAEFSFLKFARACGAGAVPAPLARDDSAGMALYEFVPGGRLSPEDVGRSAVEQAAALFARVNEQRGRLKPDDLPNAAEACFSVAQHLNLVEGRVRSLLDFTPVDDLDEAAAELVSDRLAPIWTSSRKRVLAEAAGHGIAVEEILPSTEVCVSPSDFGFHNALIDSSGRIRFIDFEYAGWDDPAKLVCDFFAQVALPAPREHQAVFEELALAPFAQRARIRERVALLTPSYGVKWACILLNDFLGQGRARRSYALGEEEDRRRRLGQIGKAQAALAGLPTS
jgi:hypothetical protein